MIIPFPQASETASISAIPPQSVLDLIGNNPAGSIKDRIVLSMIEAAEREGLIKPGDTLVEATAGNTGFGLTLVAVQKGYKLILVILDKMSQEKIFHMKAMGAQVIMTSKFTEVPYTQSVTDLLPVIEQGQVVAVVDRGHFLGLITPIDFLNYLRKRTAQG